MNRGTEKHLIDGSAGWQQHDVEKQRRQEMIWKIKATIAKGPEWENRRGNVGGLVSETFVELNRWAKQISRKQLWNNPIR